MNELTKYWLTEFQDKETRHIYAENFLNTYIATQLKVLREDREWTQKKLAEETGMKQERISVLEDVNYESWTIKTLKRFAWAYDLCLSIKFDSFGSFLKDYDKFNRDNLKRLSFDKDPVFHPELAMPDNNLNRVVVAESGTGKSTVFGRMMFERTLQTSVVETPLRKDYIRSPSLTARPEVTMEGESTEVEALPV